MFKSFYVFVILVLTLTLSAFAQRHDDFAGIPFGSSRQTVIEEIMKLGYEPFGQAGAGERIVIPVYKFGDLPVQVDFIFNQNDKFYAFEVRTGRVEESRKVKAIEAVSYMSDQFTLKYGKASQPGAIDEANIHNGRNIFQEWFSVKTLNANTAIMKIANRYYAVGYVEHRTLAKEVSVQKKTKEKAPAAPVF